MTKRIRLIASGALIALLIGGLWVFRGVFAFTGPNQGSGAGSGAVGPDTAYNISIGTSTTALDTKLLIVASSTGSTAYVLKALQPNSSPLFLVRNDARAAIGSVISATNTLYVNGNMFVNGTIMGNYTGFLSAANISAATFGSSTGGGNFAFPGNLTVGGGAGKISAGIIDPVYTIRGERFATYVPGMTGLKEETIGVLRLVCAPGETTCRAALDLANAPKGSDLWLFAQTTDVAHHYDALTLALTPSFRGFTWYEKDAERGRVTIFGEPSAGFGEVSYRLIAPRYDAAAWPNALPAFGEAGLIIE